MNVAGKRIFVGLSGGVDSAVTAALLQKAGADVTGVFIKGWYPPGMPCSWRDDRRDAMRVAAHLGLPFVTLDASREYKEGVIDYLMHEYRNGRTPNPDVMCNREVKFGAFYRFAKEKGAEFIATGHYAQVEHSGGAASLLRGADAGKDQSYFLWAVPQGALAHTLFPLGRCLKEDVRKLALQSGLPNAQKRDSQGICFLGSISVDDFLRAEIRPVKGSALDTEGKEIGTHDGAVLYTLGERIALPDSPPGPWYVIAKDLVFNTVSVSHGRPTAPAESQLRLTSTNFFDEPEAGEILEAQYRYHGPRIRGTYDQASNVFMPSDALTEPIASGQSLVLYRNEECLGGGIIA